ncbi:Flavinator of succinate dehydrogenase-domain-containing protein [Entophlyctis helioformis]|nr:Flavinator of succinate dehydrogenase-domain-containing protein [Entophlyctis helioformis]
MSTSLRALGSIRPLAVSLRCLAAATRAGSTRASSSSASSSNKATLTDKATDTPADKDTDTDKDSGVWLGGSIGVYKPKLAEWINPYPPKDAAGNPTNDPDGDAADWTPAFDIPRRMPRDGESLPAKRARLLWASRKRGILETDLLLSTYVRDRLAALSPAQLEEYDRLLDENDWDIYYWATGAKNPPHRVRSMSIFPDLVEHAKNKGRKILRMPDV